MASPCRKIIHIDMDAFYASVEQRDNPVLRGKPLAVGYPGARGVVAAASYEARAFGVRSAMPAVTARRKCPELVFVPPRMEVYRAVSLAIREILVDYTPLVEPLSLDEAYLDATENLRGIPSASAVAQEIRARIRDRTGLTASAGVSYNKFLAKLASDYRKPDGLFVITPAMAPAFIETLPVGQFHGIGPVTAAKMHRLGIWTGADLGRGSQEFLKRHFGKSGAWYYAMAQGHDDRPVQPDRRRRSAGSETTFASDLGDPNAIENELRSRADEVWLWCANTRRFGRTVTVKVRYADFRQITRSRTHNEHIASRELLIDSCLHLVRTYSRCPPACG